MQPTPSVQPITPVKAAQPVQLVEPVQVQLVEPVQSVPLARTHPLVQPYEPVQPVRTQPPAQPTAARSPVSLTYRASQIVYLVLGIVEALMIIRVALKLLAANASTGFASLIYGVSGPLVSPFQGIFPTPTANSNVLELSSLVAIVVYALIAWGIVRAISILERRQRPVTAS
jgi:uncharacterized protein YggT (Ycf19 family)